MKKKIYFFKFDASRTEVFLPMIWFNFKGYYEANSQHSAQWEWIPPCIDYKGWTIDQICNEVLKHDADVYAFTSYMWSWNVVKTVAERIRQKKPNAVIVLGGPHQGTTYTDPIFWFNKNPYFDATCRPTEYGEVFMLDMLDAIAEDRLDWSKVRNSYHRRGFGPLADKRSFVFPKDVLFTNLDVALDYSKFANKTNRTLTIPYETTRGCPYGCTYCEWGGGINSKVIAKPIEDIEEDLVYFPLLGIQSMYLCDANFGILPRDKDVAKLFAALSKTCLKHIYISGLAKTSSDKRKLVLEPLLEAGVIDGYQMAIQAINPQVGEIIDRVDISLEENLAMADYLIDKYNSHVKVELILGLPGFTLQDFYNECSSFYGKYAVVRGPVFILPDSPAADPAYISKWQIQLAPIGLESEETDDDYISIYDQNLVQESFYMPVSTFSYSIEDWKQMMFITDMDVVFNNRHVMKPFIDFMVSHRQQPAGEVIKQIYTAISRVPNFYNPIDEYLTQVAKGELATKDWKTIPSLDMHVFKGYYYLWINNRDRIFEELHKIFNNDNQITDCLDYVKNTTLREDYSITWSSKWDWKNWEEGNDLVLESTEIVTTASSIKWTPTLSRVVQSLSNGKQFNLDQFDAQVYGLKTKCAENKFQIR